MDKVLNNIELVGGIGEKMEENKNSVNESKNQSRCKQVRKFTPKECFRLMGVKDEDYANVSKNQSNSSLYHLAGDSIVVDVLMAIFREMM